MFKGQEDLLQSYYMEKVTGESIFNNFKKVKETMCPKVTTMHSWIKLIVEKSVPLNAVQDQLYRDLSQCVFQKCNNKKPHFSKQLVKDVMNKIVVEIEGKIATEMNIHV